MSIFQKAEYSDGGESIYYLTSWHGNFAWHWSLFDVSSHVWQCFSRFSPTFIASAGQVDGEILESLWSVLNEISLSTQNATHVGHIETLDDHMGDSNFKKMLDVGALFCANDVNMNTTNHCITAVLTCC